LAEHGTALAAADVNRVPPESAIRRIHPAGRAQVHLRSHREATAHPLLRLGPQGGAPEPQDLGGGE